MIGIAESEAPGDPLESFMSTPEQRQVDRMIDRRFHFKSKDAVDGESNTMLDAIEHDVTG